MIKIDDINIEGEFDESEESEVQLEYDIASYPSDLTLSVLYDMWKKGDVIIPDYQRNFVWNKKQSSLLIESFLIGLPVPQVFLYVNNENKYEVIDGQQRITSIIYFMDGYFGDENYHGNKQVFRLVNLGETSPFLNKKYTDLDDKWKRKLEGSILRAINIKQLNPKGENTCAYHIFERLNTGGTPLKPQEIRNVVYRGGFIDKLKELNEYNGWRKILGKDNYDKYQKDIEIVLRLFSLVYRIDEYAKPMKEFLNKTIIKHRNGETKEVIEFSDKFKLTVDYINNELDEKPFHLRGPLNLPALEAVFAVIYNENWKNVNDFKNKVEILFLDEKFVELSQVSTSDKSVIDKRILLSKKIILDA
ncbi:MAG: DUF262 domain-containing protein [Pseudomonadota bacterium]